MADDLTDRLRARADALWDADKRKLFYDAADRIDELEAERDALIRDIEGYVKAASEQAADILRLEAESARWLSLYRRAVNEANGLTNYVEERPELFKAERRLAAIESEARAALEAAA